MFIFLVNKYLTNYDLYILKYTNYGVDEFKDQLTTLLGKNIFFISMIPISRLDNERQFVILIPVNEPNMLLF